MGEGCDGVRCGRLDHFFCLPSPSSSATIFHEKIFHEKVSFPSSEKRDDQPKKA